MVASTDEDENDERPRSLSASDDNKALDGEDGSDGDEGEGRKSLGRKTSSRLYSRIEKKKMERQRSERRQAALGSLDKFVDKDAPDLPEIKDKAEDGGDGKRSSSKTRRGRASSGTTGESRRSSSRRRSRSSSVHAERTSSSKGGGRTSDSSSRKRSESRTRKPIIPDSGKLPSGAELPPGFPAAAVEGNLDGKSERKSRMHSEGYDGNDSKASLTSTDLNHQPSLRVARRFSNNAQATGGLASKLGEVDNKSGSSRRSKGGSKSVASAPVSSAKHKVTKSKADELQVEQIEEDMNSSMASLDPGLLKNSKPEENGANENSMKSSVTWMEFNPGAEKTSVLVEHDDETGDLKSKQMSISNLRVEYSDSDEDDDNDQSTNPMKRTKETSKHNGEISGKDKGDKVKKMEELLERRSRSKMKSSSSTKEGRRSTSRSRGSGSETSASSRGRRSRSTSVRRDGRVKRSVSSSRERRSDGSRRSSSRKPTESSSSRRKKEGETREIKKERLIENGHEGATTPSKKKSYLASHRGKRSRSSKEQAKEVRKSIDSSLDNFLELMEQTGTVDSLKDDGRSVSSAINDKDRKKKVKDKKKLEKFASLEKRLKDIGGDRRSTLQRTNSDRDDLSVSSVPAMRTERPVINLSKTSFSKKLQKMAVNF